jgi:nucleoside-diphosphate-sugar epimerase
MTRVNPRSARREAGLPEADATAGRSGGEPLFLPVPCDGGRVRAPSPLDGEPPLGRRNAETVASPLPRRTHYLVTGCAGFIGSHLVEALLARGHGVTGVDCFTSTYPRPVKEHNLAAFELKSDFRFIEFDLAELPLKQLLDDVDGIFHLAARPGVRTSWGATFAAYSRDNLVVTQRLFDVAAERGVRVVYASSSSVYGTAEAYPVSETAALRPLSPYGVTKLACEQMASAYRLSQGLDAVGLRYFSVYGPRQRPDMAFARIIRCAAENQPFTLLGDGRQTRDFTFVGDVVAATIAAMERAPEGAVYNVGGGGEISLMDALRLCERIGDRRIELAAQPTAAGDPARTRADIRRIGSDLAWAPSTPLEEGLRAQMRAAIGADAPEPAKRPSPV